MAEIRIINGASVNRAWGDEGHVEFLGCFQYQNHAEEFAKARIAEDMARNWHGSFYIISNHYSGKVVIVRPPKLEQAVAA